MVPLTSGRYGLLPLLTMGSIVSAKTTRYSATKSLGTTMRCEEPEAFVTPQEGISTNHSVGEN